MAKRSKAPSVKADKTFSLKDRLFNAATVDLLCAGLVRADPGFPARKFRNQVLAQFPDLARATGPDPFG